jgi:hypothetical protein
MASASVITTTRPHNTHIVISTSDDDDDRRSSPPHLRSMFSSLSSKFPHTNSYLSQLVSLYAPTTAASFSDDDLSSSKEPRLTASLLLPKVISLLHEDNEEELKDLFKDRLEIPDDLVCGVYQCPTNTSTLTKCTRLAIRRRSPPSSRLCTGISMINSTSRSLQRLPRRPASSGRHDLRVEHRPILSVLIPILQRVLLEPSRSYTPPLLEGRTPQSPRRRSTSTRPQPQPQ